MSRLKTTLQAAWRFLRELSGEAALERRMARCGCCDPREAAKQALSEQFEGTQRCC
jgi:hypothetical protein